MASILALLVLASCCKSGVLCARMVKLAADDSASAMSDDMTSSSSALEQQQQQQELEAVVSALAHMNADSEAMRRAEHYVAGFSANATIVANLDVTDQASVDAFIAAFIQLTAAALRIDPANVYVTRITKGGVSSGRRRAALEQSGAAERVWSASELSALLPGAGLSLLALKHVTPADDSTVAGLRLSKVELVLGPGAAAGGARRSAQQQQQQQPLPRTPPARVTSVRVSRMPAQGTLSGDSSKPVVWYSDASFRSYRKPRSPLTWSGQHRHHTAAEPGVVSVELLPWPATPIPELPGVAPVAGPKGPPVYSAATDSTPCGGDLVIRVPADRSGSSESVPPRGSQSELPPRLRRTAVGGIRITVKAQAAGAKPTVISSPKEPAAAYHGSRLSSDGQHLALRGWRAACKSGVLCADGEAGADDSASAMSDDMTSSSSALEQQAAEAELEAVLSALRT
ncbi:hypothetical protein HYH02_015533 [Chlamydomonas schloesseri]|uniref:Uncharacterized protein n=1 Tax=Chlamydomonas schloesseri TaxID=2026947 RepID=A0A835SJY6_9CHLO|nr:hypothetical protein HYH02_015533 [Chlamydomonas schloesseri]|eukprot:KAG2422025.1 hypothetical protein HYH02_015533 [Chlamydomonas schloesseri]